MRQIAGQAARVCAILLHRLAAFVMAAVVVCGVGAAALAWRLSQGPLDLPWLAHRMEAAVNADAEPARLRVGGAALAWEGFRLGVDRPLDVRVRDVVVTDAHGVRILDIPRGEVSLSLGRLLIGELRPRALQMDGARMRLVRTADGSLDLDWPSPSGSDEPAADAVPSPGQTVTPPLSLPDLLAELAHPAATDRSPGLSRYSQVRRVLVRDAAVTVVDRTIGATWQVTAPVIDFTRQTRGGVQGTADATVALGGQRATLHAAASLGAGGTTQAHLTLAPLNPAAWATITPALRPLAMLDAPVGAELTVEVGRDLAVRHLALDGRIGSGTVRVGASQVPLVGVAIKADGTMDAIELPSVRLELRARDSGPSSVIQLRGTVGRDAAGVHAKASLDLDRVAFADLPQLWPEGTGGGARAWVTTNITAGTGRNAHVDFAVDAPPDLSNATLTQASGTLEGDDLTVWWLRPVPPIEHAQATLRILDPDTIDIVAQGGRQRPSGRSPSNAGLLVRRATMRITGIEHSDQFGAVAVEVAGSLPDTIALLSEPRLQLLSKHPVPLKDAAGSVSVRLTVQVPLEDKVQIEQIAIRAQARLTDVHLADIVAGRDLDQGAMTLDASNDGLKLNGRAVLAGIPSDLSAELDFRAGPPSQILQKFTASGTVGAPQLASFGLGAGPMSGTAAVQAVMTERRDGQGQVDVAADLAGAALTASPLDWRKEIGQPATASVRIRLDHDKLVAVDAISVEADGLSVRGRAAFVPGQSTLLRLDRIVVGRTEAAGSVRFPPAARSAPIQAAVTGRTLDLSAALSHVGGGKSRPTSPSSDTAGPPWTLDAKFDRALMAKGRTLTSLALTVDNDGRLMRRLHFEGFTGPGADLRLDITPDRSGRRLAARAADAGALLRAFDLADTIEGGVLTVSGTYNDAQPDHPLSGVAEITTFRMRNAPFLAHVLQAMTLYGLVELVQGPGLGISRLIAPFTLAGDVLELRDARAFSPSIGLTAKGWMNLATSQADLEGTIVPAYFFNSLLGRVPLIGRLFSPEKGGGLFAASYAVRGPLSDPRVSVNPLSALTPGFLRGLFGMF